MLNLALVFLMHHKQFIEIANLIVIYFVLENCCKTECVCTSLQQK